MKFPSIFNKINPQSIQQHPEKNELNWMLELNQWKAERILTGEIHRPECRNEAAKRINCAFLSKQNNIDLSGLNLTTQPPDCKTSPLSILMRTNSNILMQPPTIDSSTLV